MARLPFISSKNSSFGYVRGFCFVRGFFGIFADVFLKLIIIETVDLIKLKLHDKYLISKLKIIKTSAKIN